jgi:hypothetical protein
MKFNTKTKGSNRITNYEGAPAYKMSAALELYAAVVTTSLSKTFYEGSGLQRIKRLRELIKKNDPLFVAQLAVYAREKMYLRSVPLVLAVELAKVHNGDDLVSRLVSRVVQRADEIAELLAYYQAANQRNGVKKLNRLSKQLQRGLALAFNKFDEYQFAKYNRPNEVKLRDALFLVHPKAKDETQQGLFDKIVNDGLEVPYTWETQLSELGQQKFANDSEKASAFRAKWQELIDSQRLGYMALMRNLRNMLEAGISTEHLAKVTARLSDPAQVARAKQLPFRFLSAYRELKNVKSPRVSKVLEALEAAILASTQNLKGFDENTDVLIACDTSGSMTSPVSPRSSVQMYDIGLVLGMLLQSNCQSVMSGVFGDTWKVINLPRKQVLANADALRNRMGEVGYATNGYLVIKDLIARKQKVDKVMIFTDCQLWNSHYSGESIAKYWAQYKKIAPEAKLYLFDLAGYGQSPVEIKKDDVALIAGWSDKVFEILEALENGQSAITEIKNTDI